MNVFVAMTGLYQLSRKYLGVEYVAIFPFEKHGPYDPFGDYTIFPSDAFSFSVLTLLNTLRLFGSDEVKDEMKEM